MLLDFKTKNYKSFRDEIDFSMTPAPKQKGLDYSILSQKVGKTNYKGLSSAVIYGPNASGKTNVVGAMDTFRTIVLSGNIRNADSVSSPNAAAYRLELIPCRTGNGNDPVEFSVRFLESDMVIEYNIKIAIGAFLDTDYPRKVLEETLYVNELLVFSRLETLKISDDLAKLKKYLNNNIIEKLDSAEQIAQTSLNDQELFLTNGFKTIFGQKLVALIYNWFESKFMIVYRADSIQLTKRFADPKENTIYIASTINDAAEAFGINSNALGFKTDKDSTEAKLYSIFKNEKHGAVIPAEMYESYGTIRFVTEFPLVIRALLTGATLVMDEFDASIHPMALMSIINLFHNDDINVNRAQLIFNTHNPIFLNANLYRRDEIKFVERDDETHESTHYALSDFKTSGETGVRKGEDYMKNYFISRYGAIKDVDFSSILENLIAESGGEEDE